MADTNRIRKRRVIPRKEFKLSTTEILNFGVDGNPSVLLINKGSVSNGSTASTAKKLRDHAKNSPWTEDKLAQSFADESLKKTRKKSSIDALQDFVATLRK